MFGAGQAEKILSKGRGKDTLFRVTVRNQIDQISIADNKANMIISINTIIITGKVARNGLTHPQEPLPCLVRRNFLRRRLFDK